MPVDRANVGMVRFWLRSCGGFSIIIALSAMIGTLEGAPQGKSTEQVIVTTHRVIGSLFISPA